MNSTVRNRIVSTGLIVAIAVLAFVVVMRIVGASGSSDVVGSDDLRKLMESEDVYVVDVRTPAEYAAGAIPGAVNIPHDQISATNVPTKDKSAKIVVYCRSGSRSSMAKSTLDRLGYTDVVDFGAISNWSGRLE